MQTIAAFYAKTHFSSLLEQVEKGDQIVITKHGRPVARLVPITVVDRRIQIKLAIQKIKQLSQLHTLGHDWKDLRDERRS